MRYCPECDQRTERDTCPTCVARTYVIQPAVEHHDPLVGRVLDGRYKIQSLVGKGGMGAVYRALRLALDVARSLAEAHGRGLVHRDLKPDNVMLVDAVGAREFVKVLDFGIAKLTSGDSGESSVTRSGAIVGTPYYMAPEQATGKGVTGAADLYALGVMLYEMLVGVRPFEEDTPVAIPMHHVHDAPPDLPSGPSTPPRLVGLVRELLRRR